MVCAAAYTLPLYLLDIDGPTPAPHPAPGQGSRALPRLLPGGFAHWWHPNWTKRGLGALRGRNARWALESHQSGPMSGALCHKDSSDPVTPSRWDRGAQ